MNHLKISSEADSILQFRNAKKLTPTQELAIIQILSRKTANDAFGKFVRDLIFDRSTILDYNIVATKLKKHFPELKEQIEIAIN